MSKKATFIIPLNHPLNRTSDHYRQTISILKKQNTVIAYHHYRQPINLYNLFKIKKQNHSFIFKALNADLYHITPISIIPFNRFSFIKQINEKISIYLVYLFSLTKKKKVVLWLANPIFYWMAIFAKLILKNKIIIYYDCLDYLTSKNESIEKQLREGDEKLVEIANLVTVNNEVLLKYHKKQSKKVILIPAGFRKKDFNRIKKKTIKKPIVGYAGTINNRIDFTLLYQICKNNPQINFSIVGPIYENEEDSEKIKIKFKKITKLKNVFWTEFIQPKKLGEMMSEWQIGIIPYNKKQLMNFYSQPLKAMEFFYLGLSVISTPLPSLEKYKKYISICSNKEKWNEKIKELLNSKPNQQMIEEMQKIAINNSWENKIKKTIKYLNL